MKSIRFRLVAFATLVGVGILLLSLNHSTTLAVEGGPYVLDWHAFGLGGGSSSGGDYAINSAVGQPVADVLTGNDYDLGGGFWGGGPRVVAPVTPTPTSPPTATATATTPGKPTSTATATATTGGNPTATATTRPGTPTATPTPPETGGGDGEIYLPLVRR